MVVVGHVDAIKLEKPTISSEKCAHFPLFPGVYWDKELRVSWKSRFCFKTECKMAGSRNGHVLHNYLNTLTRSLYITVHTLSFSP